jgi:type II secretory pathway component PulK
MRPRRGFALLAAIWLIVAIAVVALQFSLDARERRVLGINTAERGQGQAAAMGALNATEAAMDAALRQGPGTGNANTAGLRRADPWLDSDSLFSGPIMIDSIPVDVRARDLGTQLNINLLTEDQLKTFLNFALRDFDVSDHLSQAILDWRDADTIPRPNGAEKDQYIKDERLALPTNQAFRDVRDLLDVEGMTPAIYDSISPYLTVRGDGRVNINEADTLVLRSIPGMTDRVFAFIVSQRSMGRRIASMQQILSMAGVAGGGGRGGAAATAQQNAIANFTTVDVLQVELTITARVGPQQMPARLQAIVTRPLNGRTSSITWKQW